MFPERSQSMNNENEFEEELLEESDTQREPNTKTSNESDAEFLREPNTKIAREPNTE
jgi:hypothetical protein